MATKEIKAGDPVLTGGLAAITGYQRPKRDLPADASRLDRLGVFLDKYSPYYTLDQYNPGALGGAALDSLTLGAESIFDYMLSPDPYGEQEAAKIAEDMAYRQGILDRIAEKEGETEKARFDERKRQQGIITSEADIDTPLSTGFGPSTDIDVTDVDVSDITADTPKQPTSDAPSPLDTGFGPPVDQDFGSLETADGAGKDGDQSGQPQSILSNYENLMKQSLDSYQEALDRAPSGAKSMDEYKQEFSEATGIDISGDPDNKAALMAFGLALMQNKAGKGFDVGKMLSSVGAAGEKALPVMQKAREEARAAQLAAGKYALDKGSEADKLRQSYLIDQSNYLTKRKAQINDMAVARMETVEDRDIKLDAAEELAHINGMYDAQIAETEARLEYNKALAEGKEVDISNTWEEKDIITGQPKLSIRKGLDQNGNTVILDGSGTARKFADAYGNIIQAEGTIDKLESLLMDMGKTTGSPTGDILLGRVEEISRGLGLDIQITEPITIVNADGTKETRPGISAEAQANAMVDRLLAQYKRFLSQETGNGISEGDFQRLSKLIGQIQALSNPQEKLARLDELREMFNKPKQEILGRMQEIGDSSMYATEDQYNKAISVLNDAAAFNTATLGINISQDDDGLLTYDLTKTK